MRSFRVWGSIATVLVLALFIALSWHEIIKAFGYLSRVNLGVLSLLIPAQCISYLATAEVLFSYLRRRGSLTGVHPLAEMRMSLEFNFVNHILPSGGASGISYAGWKLSHYGVKAGVSTMAQLVRFALTFISFIILLAVSFTMLLVDHSVTAIVTIVSAGLVIIAGGSTLLFFFLAKKQSRLHRFAAGAARFINRLVKWFTRGRVANAISAETVERFSRDAHHDYTQMSRDRRVLIEPFLWSFLANIADASLFMISFWALGVSVNPGLIFIAYGLSTITSILMVTPGGAGFYEVVMIGFLAAAGVPSEIAIAATLLTRIILLLGTILFGYAFYQATILRYGHAPVGKGRNR